LSYKKIANKVIVAKEEVELLEGCVVKDLFSVRRYEFLDDHAGQQGRSDRTSDRPRVPVDVGVVGVGTGDKVGNDTKDQAHDRHHDSVVRCAGRQCPISDPSWKG